MDFLRILSDQRREILSTDVSALLTRKEEKEIRFDSPLAQVVVGVRRCGKSTLCKKVLIESGLKFGYINFDDERLADIKTDQLDRLVQVLYELNGEFNLLFIDEIQNVHRWELFVNRMLRQGMHMVITGSNANLLGGDLTTHLAGRFNEIKLYPFSFSEYCSVKGVSVNGVSTIDQGLRQHYLNEYLFTGGFPEIVKGYVGDNYASDLLHTIIYKDICKRYKVRYKETIRTLANIVLDRVCQEQSAYKLASDLEIKSFHTVENYLSYLSDAYLICPVNRFSWKPVERRKIPKFYAIDNSFISAHEGAIQSDVMGWRLENTVAVELLNRNEKAFDRLYYLKETRDYEVDFVVVKNSGIHELIQVTYDFSDPSVKLYNREVGALIKGAEKTKCENLTLLIGNGEPRTVESKGHIVNIKRAADWLVGL